MPVPPVGAYWLEHAPDAGAPLSRHFIHIDNAARRPLAEHVERAWERYKEFVNPGLYFLLEDLPKGRPPRHSLRVGDRSYMASVSSIEFAAMASTLWGAILGIPGPLSRVVEIGGGYGGLAVTMQRCVPGIRWDIVDIPSVARVARWYLDDWAPFCKVHDSTCEEASALIRNAGVIVQTRGFMEMSKEEIAYYFDLIQSACPGTLFFTINRLSKITRLVDWPWDSRWRMRVARPWPGGMAELLLERTVLDQGDLPHLLSDIASGAPPWNA